MTTTLLHQLGIIPAVLITLAGVMILRDEDKDRGTRRLLLFLLGAGILIQLALFITKRFFTEPYNQPFFQANWLLAPPFLGILALMVLNGRQALAGMDGRRRITAGALALVMVVLFMLNRDARYGMEYIILPSALVLAIGWGVGNGRQGLSIALGLLCLGLLVSFNHYLNHPPDYTASPPTFLLIFLFFFGYNVWPALAVVMSGVLLTTSLQTSDTRTPSRRMRCFMTGLAIALPLCLAYITFWGSVWDQTSDGLTGIFLSETSAIIAIGAGMLMVLALRGRNRLAGFLFMLAVPVLLNLSFVAGWDVSYHKITEERAARIARALDQFKEREGYYPVHLEELIPRDLLFIRQPMILAGKEWCYQGGGDFYRLATYYREFFGMPLSLRIYASAGEPPESVWECEAWLAELKEQYDPPPFAGIPETAPTPVPLPTSVTTVERKTVQPIVQARTISVGTWSPDGMVLVLGLPEVAGDQSVMGLAFLRADTGEVCPAGDRQWATGWDDGLREHFAWLPDGRLLYVPSSGEVTLLRPCETDSVDLAGSYPVTFTHALDYHEASGRVLLKNRDSFWILDGTSLEAIQIPEAAPNPFEFHWDNFDWSPDGSRLAISRLNGQTAKDGSTLFIVNAETGQVETELPLETASDQSAPMVEWMTEEELLLHGGSLLVIDFRTDPPSFTDILRDVFLLDISYPNDISSFAWEGRHLSVRVNHPRNQGIYVFHPETGKVEIIQPGEASPLFFFLNGEMVEMANYTSDPPAADAYELIWVDTPSVAPQYITVQGHQPRNYPNLFPRYLPGTSQLAFSSSQGVSLVSIPDGEILGFWELAGGDGFSTSVLPPSASEALVVVADGVGLYYIPLP